ncbi:hypothetical protein EV701_13536 [Chthoniobacter flavus]|nr:hypothetical protein EV701_13536 [Chthoniobacter flavus]
MVGSVPSMLFGTEHAAKMVPSIKPHFLLIRISPPFTFGFMARASPTWMRLSANFRRSHNFGTVPPSHTNDA